MEVKPGYKQTEIGVIPEDWETYEMSSLCSITTGKRNTQDRVVDGLYPFFVRSQEVERINTYSYDGESILTAGDGVGTGKVYHYINGKFDFHQRVYKLSDFPVFVDGYFLYLYFKSHFLHRIQQFTAKTSVDSVRLEMISKMPVPIPSVYEQKSISKAMKDIDSLITSLEKLIEKKKLIKQGVMQDFLTGKKRLPGFTGEWETKSLDEILSYERPDKYYVTNTEYADAGLVPVLTANKSFVLGYTNDTDGICHNIPAIIFDDFTTDSKYVDFPFKVKSSAIKILRTKHNGDVLLLIYCILQMISFPLGDHKRYYLSEYRYLSIKIPGKVEQKALSAYLEDMESEIKTLEKQLAKYQLIKEGMMQELLTGRIRLI